MGERPALRVLIVDDDADMARLLRVLLEQQGFGPIEHVGTGAAALDVASRFDVVLLDHQLPDVSGVEVVASLRSGPHPPSVVLVTGHGNEALAAAALRRGADDYLVKDASLPHLLPEVLERVRRARALRIALAAAQEELVKAERLAAIGEMTVALHHEINNPLMAASAEVDILLSRRDALDPEQGAALEDVRSALNRIRDIVLRIGTLREARATGYAGDVRMIDLSPPPGGAPPDGVRQCGTALVYLPDDDLARVLSLLLSQAGYGVRRCPSTADLADATAEPDVRLAVFAATHAAPTGGLALNRARDFRAVAIAADDETARRAVECDLVVRVPFDPARLAEELARIGSA